MTGLVLGDLFGGAFGDDGAAVFAGFGADVDEVVGLGEDVGVVLDDDDGVAFVDEAVKEVDEAGHVGGVEADGGFLDEVEIALGGGEAAHALGGGLTLADIEFGDQLQTLGLAAAERGAGLAELEVADTGLGEEIERAGDSRDTGEELGGLGDAHFEDLADVFAVVLDLQRGGIEPHAVADLAVNAGGGEEVHFDLHLAVSRAVLTATAFGVEGEATGAVTSCAGGGELGEELPDVVHDPDVGGGAGAGGFSNRALIDLMDGVDGVKSSGGLPRLIGELLLVPGFGGLVLGDGEEDAVEEGAFSRATDARDDREATEGDVDVDVLEVVR